MLDELPTMDERLQLELQLTVFPNAMTQSMPEDVEVLSFHIAFDANSPHNQVTVSSSGGVLFFRSVQSIPIWIYVSSAVLGMAILTAVTYELYKVNMGIGGV